jgi:uncharacterized YccA/Bax inhibitor family protein
VRTTSNPAFRNLPGRGGYATTFNQPGAQAYPRGYAGYGAPPTTAERPVTVDDVVTKTAITLATTVVAGLLTAYFHALIIIFRQTPNPALVLTYAAAEGVALGAISALFETLYSGIVLQAIIGTVGVFIGMLVVYKTGAVRVTPRLTKWIVGATVGAAVLMLANLVMGLFTHGAGFGLRSGGPLAIGFSLLVIGIAAFNFLLDFDAADQMIRAGMPSKWAWYAAFGLMTTLVWLYLEILRLLSYLNRR